MDGYVNVDVRALEHVDQVVDLNVIPWPWEDSSVDEIYCQDGLEHLCPLGRGEGQINIIAILSEIHRVLKPGGMLEAYIPSTDGRGAWQDPTHVTYWNKNSFLYYLAGEGEHNIYNAMPKFSITDRNCFIMNSTTSEMGIVWVCVKIRAVKEPGEKVAERA